METQKNETLTTENYTAQFILKYKNRKKKLYFC